MEDPGADEAGCAGEDYFHFVGRGGVVRVGEQMGDVKLCFEQYLSID